MRKNFGFLLVCLIVVVLVASCAPPVEDVPEESNVVYYVAMIGNNVWEVSAAQNFEDIAEELGYEPKLLNAENSADNQINQMNTIISLGPKAICLKSVDTTMIADVSSQAVAAGIPVITFDGAITDGSVSMNVDVGLEKYGRMAAEELLKVLVEKYGTETGKVFQLMGDLGVPYSPLMSKGFHEVMDQYPDITVIDKDTVGWEITTAANVASDVLTVNDDIDVMFVHTDSRFPGVVSVLQEKGYEAGDIAMIGIDGDPTALDLIREGWVLGSITPPMTAYVAGCLEFVDELRAGETLEPGTYTIKGAQGELVIEDWGPHLYMPGILVTLENVDDPALWGNAEIE